MTHTQIGFKPYFLAFLFFIALTLTSYFVVVERLLSGWHVIGVIIVCAFLQATLQLGIFLDLMLEPKPRSNLYLFALMLSILVIVIAGTLWIMYSLKERVMMPMEGI